MKGTQKNIKQELEAIRTALSQFKEGASLEDIKTTSRLDIALRSLQRRLEKLHEQGEITQSGKTRSTLYYLVRDSGGVVGNDGGGLIRDDSGGVIRSDGGRVGGKAEPDKSLVSLTTGGRKIFAMISRPKQQRNPVEYNRYFLQLYRPNNDSYLSTDEKAKLAEMGKTARFDQPPGTYARETLNRLLVDLACNSSRLEGNSYSLLDTERLISLGEADDSKSAAEAQMILNHKDAIEFIVQSANGIGFNRHTILNLHALLSNNLLPDPAASGRLRTLRAGVQQSVYTPLAIPQQIEEMFSLMLEKAEHIKDPFEQAFFVMVQLPYLQPFDNSNKRVARLAANIALNRENLAPLSFIDVPNDIYMQGMIGVYELNRVELLKDVFLWGYERSSLRYTSLRQSLGEPDPFRLKYREQIRGFITEIVSGPLSHKEATALIRTNATQLPENDQPKFILSVETELLALHEGNFARYRISPSVFRKWKEVWAKSKTH